jgi:phospholipid/cholesterol/gamma-HCH transport system substrate-binding protein
MELRYRREATVGALIVAGAALFVFLMMWLQGRRWTEGQLVTVIFSDVAGLKVGDPVRTSGVHVGQVQRIRLLGPGRVDVQFDVAGGPEPRADASATIRAMDVFGARYIEYSPGRAAEPLPPGTELTGARLPDMAEMAGELGDRGNRLLDETATLTRDVRAALGEVRELLRTLNAGSAGASERLAASLEELRHVLQRTDLLLAQSAPAVDRTLQSAQRAAANSDTLAAALVRTTAQIDSLLAKVNAGRGLAGALVNDTTLVPELRATNTALHELLVDLKANPSRYIRFRL